MDALMVFNVLSAPVMVSSFGHMIDDIKEKVELRHGKDGLRPAAPDRLRLRLLLRRRQAVTGVPSPRSSSGKNGAAVNVKQRWFPLPLSWADGDAWVMLVGGDGDMTDSRLSDDAEHPGGSGIPAIFFRSASGSSGRSEWLLFSGGDELLDSREHRRQSSPLFAGAVTVSNDAPPLLPAASQQQSNGDWKNRVRRRLEMAENNRVGQQEERIPPIVPPSQNQAAQQRLRDIQRPVIVVNPCYIQLSDAARNYDELKSFHMNLLPTFNGLGSEDVLGFMRELYNTAAGGYTGDKNSDELQAIFESLASNSRQKPVRGRRATVHEISTQFELTTQVAELTKQINLLMTRDNSNREFCAYCNTYGHNSSFYMNAESSQPSYEEENYMGSNMGRQPPRNDPFSHTYNPGWRNHPNFSWRDQGNARLMGPPGFQQQGPSGSQHQQYRPFQQPPAPQQPQFPAQEKKPQLEEMFMQYMASQDTMIKMLDPKIDKVAQSSQASIHNIEVQVGQLAKLVAEKDRGKFPSATEINPREGAMVVTLRSGKMLNEVLKEKDH
nr:Retrotransposon gag protein [Ipomoea batatas]